MNFGLIPYRQPYCTLHYYCGQNCLVQVIDRRVAARILALGQRFAEERLVYGSENLRVAEAGLELLPRCIKTSFQGIHESDPPRVKGLG